MGGAAGGDADEPAPGIGLRLQRAAAPDRAGAGRSRARRCRWSSAWQRWASRWARSARPSSIASRPRRSWCWRAPWWPPPESRSAAMATGLAQLLLGYGIVFGTGGGMTYILLQQGVNMLVRRRQGLVNGYIVSLYPMGAMIATPAFHACNEAFGWRTTLAGLAAVLVACGVAAALLARHGGARLVAPAAGSARRPARNAGAHLLQALGDVLPRRLGRADGAEPGARDRRRLWRGDRAGGGGHDRPHRRDRAGAHQRRLAGRSLRGAAP